MMAEKFTQWADIQTVLQWIMSMLLFYLDFLSLFRNISFISYH
uniref:Uncharacterized protein n=1 Tax=Scytodes thoracica TaxID=1112478 RepID=A0A0A0V694_SCYTH|nr:hypothetical protein [Scytodes thoracica]